jgi:hypothetical protein
MEMGHKEMITEIEKLLDDRTMGGTLSATRLAAILEENSNQGRMAEMYNAIQRITRNMRLNEETTEVVQRQDNQFELFYHRRDGVYRRVPEGWTFPQVNIAIAYQHWHVGDTVKKIVALKKVDCRDVAFVKRGKQNLCDFRKLMTKIDIRANQLGLLRPTMDIAATNVAYLAARSAIELDTDTLKGRKRALAKITWSSALRLLRRQNKAQQEREEREETLD